MPSAPERIPPEQIRLTPEEGLPAPAAPAGEPAPALTSALKAAVQWEELPEAARRGAAMAAAQLTHVRWDRIARWAMLGVLVLIVYLYAGPTRAWIAAYAEARDKREQVAALKERNADLRERHRALKRSATLEREARRLGMVRAGERAYVVKGLPAE